MLICLYDRRKQEDYYLVQYNTPTADIDTTIKPNVSGKDIFKTKSSLVPETIQFISKE